MDQVEKVYYGLKEAAHYAGLKPRTIRAYTKMGLPCLNMHGRKILIKRDDLDAFLQKFRENSIDDVVNDVLADLKVSRRKR